MTKNSLRKKIKAYAFILVILIISLVGGVSAKYIHNVGSAKKLMRAKEFYFTSNLLTEEGKDYSLNADTEGVTFTLENGADEFRLSEDDIEYEVTVSVKDSTENPQTLTPDAETDEESHPVLTSGLGVKDIDYFTLTGLDSNKTYIVTAVGKSVYTDPETNVKTEGYEKTLTATFTLAKDDVAVYKHLEKTDAYVLLTVWAENKNGTMSIQYPNNEGTTILIPDNTDPMMKNERTYKDGKYVEINFTDEISFDQKYSSYTYRFFVDKKETLSVDNFTVKLEEHVASPGEPK